MGIIDTARKNPAPKKAPVAKKKPGAQPHRHKNLGKYLHPKKG